MTRLDRDFFDKLGKVLGLLGSAYDVEVLAAGRRANEMIRGAGLRWADVIAAPSSPIRAAIQTNAGPRAPGARDMARACLDEAELFNPRELAFLRSIRRDIARGHKLSAKQFAWLCDLHERVEQQAAA